MVPDCSWRLGVGHQHERGGAHSRRTLTGIARRTAAGWLESLREGEAQRGASSRSREGEESADFSETFNYTKPSSSEGRGGGKNRGRDCLRKVANCRLRQGEPATLMIRMTGNVYSKTYSPERVTPFPDVIVKWLLYLHDGSLR